MNKLFLSLSVITTLTATTALSEEIIVKYPEKYCDQILSQEYSTGGGKNPIQILEILCKDTEGNYRGLVTTMTSISGIFGFGRFTIPSAFIYKPYDGETLTLEN